MSDFSTPEIAAGYTRCSTERQEDSPEVQWSIIDAYCKKHNLVIPPDLRFTDFDVSSSIETPRRPDGGKLFKAVLDRKRRLFTKVVIVRLDRTFRDILDQEQTFRAFAKAGVEFVGAKHNLSRQTAQERRNLAYDGVSAQYEREITGERVKEHNIKRHQDGLQPCGYPSLGLAAGPTSDAPLVVDHARMPSAIRAFEIFAASGGNFRATVRQLNEEGVPTRRGAKWHTVTVRYMLGAPNYRQMSYYAGEMIHKPDLIPPTIPADLLEKVNDILIGIYGHWHIRERNEQAKTYARRVYSGLVKCGLCGSPMDFHSYNHRLSNFVCRRRSRRDGYGEQCPSAAFDGATLDWLVGHAIKAKLESVAGLPASQSIARKVDRGVIDIPSRVAAIEDSRQRVLALYVDGDIPRAEWERQKERLDAEAAKLTVKDEPTAVPLMGIREVKEVLTQWDDIWRPDFENMSKRDMLTRVLGVGHGGIVALRIKDEAHRYEGEFWVDVTAGKIGGMLPRVTHTGKSVRNWNIPEVR